MPQTQESYVAGATSRGQGFAALAVSSSDSLRLHARDYGPRHNDHLPVVCLPGLTRNAADFHELAVALSQHPGSPRRVLALDFRGRGRSAWDRDWHRYDVRIEAADTLQVLTAAGIEEAVFIGTSRGGIVAMALAALRPAAIRGVVLNDIGPVIDAGGLIRLRGQIGKLPRPKDFGEGGLVLKRLMGGQFSALSEGEWEMMARKTWRAGDEGLVPDHDPALINVLSAIDLEAPLQPLWFLFEVLKRVPVLVLRGARSDILSEKTVADMTRRHPRLRAYIVPDQGHAPLLLGATIVDLVQQFMIEADTPAVLPRPASPALAAVVA